MFKMFGKKTFVIAAMLFASTANAALMRVDFTASTDVGRGSFIYDSDKLFQPVENGDFYANFESFSFVIDYGVDRVSFDEMDVSQFFFQFGTDNVVRDLNFNAMNPDGRLIAMSGASRGAFYAEAGTILLHYEVTGVTPMSPPAAEVPEPATLGIFGLGLLGLAATRRKLR